MNHPDLSSLLLQRYIPSQNLLREEFLIGFLYLLVCALLSDLHLRGIYLRTFQRIFHCFLLQQFCLKNEFCCRASLEGICLDFRHVLANGDGANLLALERLRM